MIGVARARIGRVARERNARLPGQHPVEQHEVGQRALDHRLRGFGVDGALDVVTRVREVDLQELEDRRLVLDDQDRRRHGDSTPARISAADWWRTSSPLTACTTASAMFFAWSPMRSIDLAMNTISIDALIVRGSSIM